MINRLKATERDGTSMRILGKAIEIAKNKLLRSRMEDGVTQYLIPRLCRADLGQILYFGLVNAWKIAGEILSKF